MIAQIQCSEQYKTIQLFTTHSDNLLIHRRIQNDCLHSQLVLEDVLTKIVGFKFDKIYHIFGLNLKKELFYLKRFYDRQEQTWINEQKIIGSNIVQESLPQIVESSKQFYLYFHTLDNKIVQKVLQKINLHQISQIQLNKKTSMITDLKVLKINQQFHFLSLLQQDKISFSYIKIQNSLREVQWKHCSFQLMSIQAVNYSNNNQIAMIAFDKKNYLCKITIQLPQLLVNYQRFIIVNQENFKIRNLAIHFNKDIEQILYFIHNQQQISRINIHGTQPLFTFNANQKILDISVFLYNNQQHVLFMNKNERIIWIINQQNNWKIYQQKPVLNWEETSHLFQPIGDQGWHADAFYSKQLGFVAKKMRRPNSYLSHTQIRNLDHLSNCLNVKCMHQIIHKRRIVGHTIPFIPGNKWDNLLNQTNLFSQSPIARVLLAQKLTNIIKILQLNNFCHGDLHLSNILIDIQKSDIVNPQFQMQVIDFGNGFVFRKGQLVSYGLTGLQIIVPFEIQSVRKKDYNPIGLNAYQLGRNILQILLLCRHSDVSQLGYYPTKQLNQLKLKKDYPSQLYEFVFGLVQEDSYKRNNWLFKDISNLVEKTRMIYLQNH